VAVLFFLFYLSSEQDQLHWRSYRHCVKSSKHKMAVLGLYYIMQKSFSRKKILYTI